MSLVPASIKAPHEPQVNLLPPEVEARRARGRQRGVIIGALVAFIAGLGAAVYWAVGQESSAKSDLEAAVVAGNAIKTDIAKYDYVLDLQSQLANAADALIFTGATEVSYSEVMRDMLRVLPPGTTFIEVEWAVTSLSTVAPPSSNPFDIPDIGTVALLGELPTFVSGAELEDALNTVRGLSGARINVLTRQEADSSVTYAFEGTVRVTALALSGRFTEEWFDSQRSYLSTKAAEERLRDAKSAYLKAEVAQSNGEPGAEAALAAADTERDDATRDAETLAKLQEEVATAKDAVTAAEEAVTSAQAAVARKEENADALLVEVTETLTAAQAELEKATTALVNLEEALLTWRESVEARVVVEARIAAADSLLTQANKKFDTALAALDGSTSAEEKVAEAQAAVVAAEAVLTEEESYLADAEEAEESGKAAYATALEAAESEGGTP